MNGSRQPLLLDTSAESRLHEAVESPSGAILRRVLAERSIAVSAVTVAERMRGFSLAREKAEPARRRALDQARLAYLSAPREIVPMDGAVAVVGGELMALLPHPPSPPKRSHRGQENRTERLARWRFDILIAATAIVRDAILVHENAPDFHVIQQAVQANLPKFPGLRGLVSCRLSEIATLLL
jgi:predicted nucleic acid-binding protein